MYLNLRYKQTMYLKYLKVQNVDLHNLHQNSFLERVEVFLLGFSVDGVRGQKEKNVSPAQSTSKSIFGEGRSFFIRFFSRWGKGAK